MNFQEANKYNRSSRRAFLQQIAALCISTQLPLGFTGCTGKKETAFQGSGKVPYKVWEEMPLAVQSCSDYLEGRRKRLVEAKDPEAMFHFVRNEIYLMPASDRALRNVKSGSNGELRITGALRYGTAPRKKPISRR